MEDMNMDIEEFFAAFEGIDLGEDTSDFAEVLDSE